MGGHGTTATPVQSRLRWEVSTDTADRICSFNRHYAEYAGYWRSTKFVSEVVWENMRVLKDGEAVSVDGTHLGHNLPDSKGNRYCINLVSIAGRPENDGIIYYINHDNDEHN